MAFRVKSTEDENCSDAALTIVIFSTKPLKFIYHLALYVISTNRRPRIMECALANASTKPYYFFACMQRTFSTGVLGNCQQLLFMTFFHPFCSLSLSFVYCPEAPCRFTITWFVATTLPTISGSIGEERHGCIQIYSI